MYGVCISLVACEEDGHSEESIARPPAMHQRELLSDIELLETSMDALPVSLPSSLTIRKEIDRIRDQLAIAISC